MHTHTFADTYDGLVGYGLDRDTDESTVKYYLQKFSDDRLMACIIPRMASDELESIFELISTLLKRHLSEEEYHTLFLKDSEETLEADGS